MSGTLTLAHGYVVDASVLVAQLVSGGINGEWAAEALSRRSPRAWAAPVLAHFEVAQALRKLELSGAVDSTTAALAHADLLDLDLSWWPYRPLAERVWSLRATVTAYDASCVALAELLQVPLVTLDRRLARASGPRCEFVVPPD